MSVPPSPHAIVFFLPVTQGGHIAPTGLRRCRDDSDVFECGRIVSKLNTENKCEECAKKDTSMKSYFTKLFFINSSCAKLVPVN